MKQGKEIKNTIDVDKSLKYLDRIEMSKDEMERLYQWKDNHKNLVRNFKPSLEKGVIIVDHFHYQFFQKVESWYVFHVYSSQNGEYLHMSTLAWHEETKVGKNIYSTPMLNEESQEKFNTDIISLYASLMAFMEHFGEDKEYVKIKREQVKRKPRKKTKSKKKSRSSSVKIGKKIIKINVDNNDERITIPNRKKYERQVDKWAVRGHWRTTKKGKRVWIKPYTKGSKEGVEATKSYRLDI